MGMKEMVEHVIVSVKLFEMLINLNKDRTGQVQLPNKHLPDSVAD